MGPKEKRKQAPSASKDGPASAPRGAKRQKLGDARSIRAEPAHKALNERMELDVASFVKSHQNEIKALEDNMGWAKKALSHRAFQSVPRNLRRRTASHNVKRVPKRLRNRAAKEMREDNTPTVNSRTRKPSGKLRLRKAVAEEKNKSRGKDGPEKKPSAEPDAAKPPTDGQLSAPSVLIRKFRKRQVHKSWLPTHIYHAKRAHMTDPKSPLWKFAIPLSPTEKTYRTTHRAMTMRGCVGWDMSYMSTVSVRGREKGIIGFLRAIGVPEVQLSGAGGQKWLRGARAWHGWVKERDEPHNAIAPVTVLWAVAKASDDQREILVRVHPSAFHQLWEEFVKVAKIQKPSLKVQDLRFEIGSIEITGPSATEVLVGVLSLQKADDAFSRQWRALAGVNNLSSLPSNALLQLSVADPRLGQPHKSVRFGDPTGQEDELAQILAEWPFDHVETHISLLDGKARSDASRTLPSQKSINRRKGEALPGDKIASLPTDPQIPLTLIASGSSSFKGRIGSWTLMLPWKCTLPLWYCLMHYPISTGGNPRLAGLEQQRQFHFENNIPWFPADFPGTKAGLEWEMAQRDRQKKEWEGRPKGRRVEWSTLDLGTGKKGELGKGWACDWERLVRRRGDESPAPGESSEAKAPGEGSDEQAPTPNPTATISAPQFRQYEQHTDAAHREEANGLTLATVSLSLMKRGHVASNARIYRLPSSDKPLRDSWLALAPAAPGPPAKRLGAIDANEPAAAAASRGGVPQTSRFLSSSSSSSSAAALAAVLADTKTSSGCDEEPQQQQTPSAADRAYPNVPGEEDLVGFVTSGNYNLGEGRATGIGSVLLARMRGEGEGTAAADGRFAVTGGDNSGGSSSSSGSGGLCIVREAGQRVGRLARWQLV